MRTYLAPSSISLSEVHTGLIRKREEPFMTLLRARPKEKKTHFERFIVLGDAEPRHVEERLGSALIYNQVIDKLKPQQQEEDVDEKYAYRGLQTKALKQS